VNGAVVAVRVVPRGGHGVRRRVAFLPLAPAGARHRPAGRVAPCRPVGRDHPGAPAAGILPAEPDAGSGSLPLGAVPALFLDGDAGPAAVPARPGRPGTVRVVDLGQGHPFGLVARRPGATAALVPRERAGGGRHRAGRGAGRPVLRAAPAGGRAVRDRTAEPASGARRIHDRTAQRPAPRPDARPRLAGGRRPAHERAAARRRGTDRRPGGRRCGDAARGGGAAGGPSSEVRGLLCHGQPRVLRRGRGVARASADARHPCAAQRTRLDRAGRRTDRAGGDRRPQRARSGPRARAGPFRRAARSRWRSADRAAGAPAQGDLRGVRARRGAGAGGPHPRRAVLAVGAGGVPAPAVCSRTAPARGHLAVRDRRHRVLGPAPAPRHHRPDRPLHLAGSARTPPSRNSAHRPEEYPRHSVSVYDGCPEGIRG